MADNLPGPSCSYQSSIRRKNSKTPIIGEQNILQELFENSGSDFEELIISSGSEYLPSDNEEEERPHNNAESTSSDNEDPIPMQFDNIQGNRLRRGNGIARRLTAARRGRGRNVTRRGRARVIQPNINYQEDLQHGWNMDDNLHQIPDFTSHSGINPNYNITQETSPFEIFSIFFDNSVFESIKFQTNKYARDRITKELKKNIPLKPKSLLGKWKAVTLSEIKIFFSIILHMSLVVKPAIMHYWASAPIYVSSFCKKNKHFL